MIFLSDNTNDVFYPNKHFFYLKVNIFPIDQICSNEPKKEIIVFPLSLVIFVLASWTGRLGRKKAKVVMAARTFLEWDSGKDANVVKIRCEQGPCSYTSGCSQRVCCSHSCGQLDSTLDVINLTICALAYLFKGVIYQGKSVSIPSFLRDKTSFFSNWLAYPKDKLDKTDS